MDARAYLARIGLAAGDEVSVPALRALVRCHLEQIPFENLAISDSGGCLISLKEEDLVKKVVEGGRGGYCFELNKLFYLLVRALGYDCYPVAARIAYRRDALRPLGHRGTVVRLEGKKWFCDVGYGGPGPKGLLCLSEEAPQEIWGDTFSVSGPSDGSYFGSPRGEYVISRHDPDGVHPLISYRDEPCGEIDFETLNGYFSLHPDSVFTKKAIVYRCTPEGQVGLVDDAFTRQIMGKTVETRTIGSPEERLSLLREVFGIRL